MDENSARFLRKYCELFSSVLLCILLIEVLAGSAREKSGLTSEGKAGAVPIREEEGQEMTNYEKYVRRKEKQAEITKNMLVLY